MCSIMNKSSSAVSFSDEGRGQQLYALLQSCGISEKNVNAALLQAASMGHNHLLQILIEAGATNLVGATTCAGLSGHVHVVDALISQTRPVPFGAAFVGALIGLRKDIVDHVVHRADTEGLDRCLLMGAARIWSCNTIEEAVFLLSAIESLVKAGARNFQRAMQVISGDAVTGYWNGNVFTYKAKILERVVVLGFPYLTADFFGRTLLMVCVSFLFKFLKTQVSTWNIPPSESTSSLKVKQFADSMILGSETRESACSEGTVQDMISILSILCQNGAANLVSRRLLEVSDSNLEDVRSLLQITTCYHQHMGTIGECTTCSIQWPLKMMKFLLVECGIKELNATVVFFPVYHAARWNVLLPVVQCFLEQKCCDAAAVYLEMSIAFCQGEAIHYLLCVAPSPIDTASRVDALRAAASVTRGRPRGAEGVLFTLHLNFMDDPEATLAQGRELAELAETDLAVKKRLRDEWTQHAFEAGAQAGERHFLSWMLVRRRSCSSLCVGELPLELQVAIGYLPLYRQCSRTPGTLLSQRQRGELVTALSYLYQGSGKVTKAELLEADKLTLLGLLGSCLPHCCCEVAMANDPTANPAALRAFFKTQ